MCKAEKKDNSHSTANLIFRTFKGREFAFSMILFLLLLIIESCATNNKHGKHRQVPCPCETERYR
jgi:hypothetical protein